MKNNSALVLDCHSRAGLETLQALGKAGVKIDISTESIENISVFSKYTRYTYLQPSSIPVESFLIWLRKIDECFNYSLIVPSTEMSLLALRFLGEKDFIRIKAIMPSNQALDIALSKQATWMLAKKIGIPVPDSRLISSIEDVETNNVFPVVLKPVSSKVNIGNKYITFAPIIVKNEEQRKKVLLKWLKHTAVLQQCYIRGKGVGVELLYQNGQLCWYFTHERIHEYPLTGGASTYRKSIPTSNLLLEMSRKLLDKLSWHGPAMVEFKQDEKGNYFLMEINPRLWGSLALSIDAGVNFPIGLLSIAKGVNPGAQPFFRTPYYTRYVYGDIMWIKASLKNNYDTSLNITKIRLRTFIEWMRPLIRVESWDHFDWNDLAVTIKILKMIFMEHYGKICGMINEKIRKTFLYINNRYKMVGFSRRNIKKILFICYGNICRSPFAERYAKKVLIKSYQIESAGFYHEDGRTCPENIKRVAMNWAIEMKNHRSKRVNKEMVDKAELIVAMDLENVTNLEREFPGASMRTILLGPLGKEKNLIIEDPYNKDDESTYSILNQIVISIEALKIKLRNG
jgi:protein-tyrosine-phosphatase/predicted ATP-grasp superfamily ATP-dependent carboligase